MNLTIRDATAATVNCAGIAVETTGEVLSGAGVLVISAVSALYLGSCGVIIGTGRVMKSYSYMISSRNKKSGFDIQVWKEGTNVNLDLAVLNAKAI